MSRSPSAALPGARRPSTGLLATVASAVAAHPTRLTVVIDGYEVVSADVGRDLDFLLATAATGSSCRPDAGRPGAAAVPLPARDTVAEVRRADLGFTDDEAALLLRQCGVALPPAPSTPSTTARGLGRRAAVRRRPLEHHEAPEAAGREPWSPSDPATSAEYLLGEVLDAQTPEVRELLLSTSMPETLRPGLTEELGGPGGGPDAAR